MVQLWGLFYKTLWIHNLQKIDSKLVSFQSPVTSTRWEKHTSLLPNLGPAVFTTLHFLRNLRMVPISWSGCKWQAFTA